MKLRFLLIITALLIIFLGIVPLVTYYYFASDLKDKTSILNKNNSGVILLDRNGKPFFNFFQAKNKTYVPLSKISIYLQRAVIASEDKDFYQHPGFSIKAIIRSLYLDIQKKSLAYGGSTITQQLVKNSLLNPQKSFLRKYQELVLAQEIERRYSKSEILEMYLNSVYFGEGAFGAEGAAEVYFAKHASELNLAEASFLVGLLPAPSQYSPYTNKLDQGKVRQRMVLKDMVDEQYIKKAERVQAEKADLKFQNIEDINILAPHFALMVRDELIKKYGEENIVRSGFKVKTTIDLEWQKYAEEVVKDQVIKLHVNNVSNGAAVVMDPKTGEIKAMVGSYDWHDDKFGKVNIITSSRQPGSSFKPIVYSAGFEERLITPATILQDSRISYVLNRYTGASYSPNNYDGQFRGPVTVRRALSNSLNVPAVQVMAKVGVGNAIEMAERLGITTFQDHSRFGLSLVLGAGEVKPLELTNVYATFANGGQYNPPTAVLEIKDKYEHTIYAYNHNSRQVLEPEVAFLISSILSDNKARFEIFGNTLTISRTAAVKTGTTEIYRDAWTLGYTPSIAIGVWVGNNDGTPMDHIAGSLGAAPIWKVLMEKYLEGTPVEEFVQSNGVVASIACLPASNKTASQSATFSDYFIEGTEPKNLCGITQAQTPTITNPTLIPPTSILINPDNSGKNKKSSKGPSKD